MVLASDTACGPCFVLCMRGLPHRTSSTQPRFPLHDDLLELTKLTKLTESLCMTKSAHQNAKTRVTKRTLFICITSVLALVVATRLEAMKGFLDKLKADKPNTHSQPHGHAQGHGHHPPHGQPQPDPHQPGESMLWVGPSRTKPDPSRAAPAYTAQDQSHGHGAMNLRKLRILCLHGYNGNAPTLRSQMSSLASVMSPMADLIQVDAPSRSVGDFGWWHAVDRAYPDHRGDPGVIGQRQYRGWERSRDFIIDLFQHQGPFDGVFGFSQGAAITGLLVGLRAPNGVPTPERPLVFDFAMMVGGFPAADPELAKLYQHSDAYDLPSVHIMGRSDGIVAADTSRRLAAIFKNPTVLEHGGGHVVASTPDVRAGVQNFLQYAQKHANEKHAPAGHGHGHSHDAAAAAAHPHDPHHDPHARAADPHHADPHAHGAVSNGFLHHSGPYQGFPKTGDIDVPLWPGRRAPTMRVVFPKTQASRPAPAMVVFRGGAYATSQGSGGGTDAWFADKGIVGITVNYGTRETNTFWPNNYSDGARAMRLVRANAQAWGIDQKRIGLVGYSAGGHLASLVATSPNLYRNPDDDLFDKFTARPDILILGYPVISMQPEGGYRPSAYVGSLDNFLGTRQSTEVQRRQFSTELQVSPQTPPTFIWTTTTDSLVPANHTALFAAACRKNGVPVEEKEFPDGPHGASCFLLLPSSA